MNGINVTMTTTRHGDTEAHRAALRDAAREAAATYDRLGREFTEALAELDRVRRAYDQAAEDYTAAARAYDQATS